MNHHQRSSFARFIGNLGLLVALGIDPLFLFIPLIDSHRSCSTFDKKLAITVCVLRTFIDAIHIIFYFITELIAPRYQVCLRGEWHVHSTAVREKHRLLYVTVDIVSVLPIPQVVVLTLIQRSTSLMSKKILKWMILGQYLPRIIRIYPLYKDVRRTSSTVAESKWIGAGLNLFLYMLQSYVFGALWYVTAIEKKNQCWHDACARTSGCNLTDLFCARGGRDNNRFLNTSCPLIDPGQITNSTVFNFGMYIDALKSGVVESRYFPRKFFYCFWWGLRNLSALGQNLETSNSVEDILFAIIICVSGLFLFAVLIGNVQKYLLSTTSRVDEREEKRKDTEKWMSNRMLPKYLREHIRRYEDYKWRETRGIEEEAHFRSLPKHLRKDIKRHLCLRYLKRVPLFEVMSASLLDALCARLTMVLYTEKSYIVSEGEPVEDMLFIMKGKLLSTTTDGGRAGFFNSVNLFPGDFCGEDVLTWALDPRNSLEPHTSQLPISSRTVKALTEVEGFVLSADDIKFVASQYRLLHSRQIQHMFRFYSVQWRTWAACFIQAAWRRHCRRKLSKILSAQGENLPTPQLSLGATLYVSRFVSKSMQNRRKNTSDFSSSTHVLPPEPQKTADPSFPRMKHL
ncbi:Cyclic nucleotide-gated ion channel 11 [Cardamine amara subsp. amara]|uniref:Cyclic nucleotide-gated ion channel 11 n=1 Tax=Cardamine amara subsp. amara TaxID=228776 RepID=A0ABD0ZAB5_CARAN